MHEVLPIGWSSTYVNLWWKQSHTTSIDESIKYFGPSNKTSFLVRQHLTRSRGLFQLLFVRSRPAQRGAGDSPDFRCMACHNLENNRIRQGLGVSFILDKSEEILRTTSKLRTSRSPFAIDFRSERRTIYWNENSTAALESFRCYWRSFMVSFSFWCFGALY